jgi:hypothetical protein
VRERGVQARRAREASGDRRPTPPDNGLRFWQVLAIVGLIAATAGWTTVAVIALRPSSPPAGIADASPSDALPSDEAIPPVDASSDPSVLTHDAVDLEALLPAEVNGTSLTRQSWTGDSVLGDGSGWSTSLTTFLTTAGKRPADLEVSQALDDVGSLDLSAGAFRASGIEGPALRDAILAAFKADYPDLKTKATTVGGFDVTTVDYGDGGINSYWYVRDGVVFDIESGDLSIVRAALAALPAPGASATPSSSAPASARPSGPSASPN